ncbi:MAG: cytochrome c [Chloroflexi bacterium]|nr:cytochrome c [Chloroflexota bacterium]
MKRDLVKLVGTILLVGVTALAVLPACGGSTSATGPIPTAAQTAAKATPTGRVAPAPNTSSTGPTSTDLLARGQLLYDKTAGGVGCAHCHALDGKGQGPAQVNAPNIRGKTEGDVRAAIQGGVPMMGFLILTDEDITAVVAYLQYLNEQP